MVKLPVALDRDGDDRANGPMHLRARAWTKQQPGLCHRFAGLRLLQGRCRSGMPSKWGRLLCICQAHRAELRRAGSRDLCPDGLLRQFELRLRLARAGIRHNGQLDRVLRVVDRMRCRRAMLAGLSAVRHFSHGAA